MPSAQVLGIQQPRTMDWYLHEAILKRFPRLSAYKHLAFPPNCKDDYFEPIGIEYGRYSDWLRVQKEIDCWQQLIELDDSVARRRSPGAAIDAARSDSPLSPSEDCVAVAEVAAVVDEALDKVETSPATIVYPTTATTFVSPSKRKREDHYLPQNNWARKPGPMSAYKVSQFLAETDTLNALQEREFWSSVSEAGMFHDSSIEKLPADLIVESFNNKHLHRIGQGHGIGLGGLMRQAHAKSCSWRMVMRSRRN